MNSKKWLYILFPLIIAFSSLGFWSVEQAITVNGASVWLVPILWFSFLFLIIVLSFILIKDEKIVNLVISISFLISFLFSFDFYRILFFLFAVLLVIISQRKIKRDLERNIKIDLGKSISTGKTFLLLALSLLITSQYYSEIKDKGIATTVPKVEMSEIYGSLTPKILSAINPQYQNISTENVTVDEFILENEKNQMGSYLDNMNIPNAELLIDASQQMILEEGRQKFSDLSGQAITGSEKVTDIFSVIINKKVDDYLVSPFLKGDNQPIFPAILAFILFFTVVSLSGLVARLLVWIIILLFKIFIKLGWVKVNRVMMEVERID